jgi:hypothetical protein
MRLELRDVPSAVEKWKLVTCMVFGIGKEERVYGRFIGAVGFMVLLVRSVVMWSFISIRRCLGHE